MELVAFDSELPGVGKTWKTYLHSILHDLGVKVLALRNELGLAVVVLHQLLVKLLVLDAELVETGITNQLLQHLLEVVLELFEGIAGESGLLHRRAGIAATSVAPCSSHHSASAIFSRCLWSFAVEARCCSTASERAESYQKKDSTGSRKREKMLTAADSS